MMLTHEIAAPFAPPSPTELHTPAACHWCGVSARHCRALVANQLRTAFICDACLDDAQAAIARTEAYYHG